MPPLVRSLCHLVRSLCRLVRFLYVDLSDFYHVTHSSVTECRLDE